MPDFYRWIYGKNLTSLGYKVNTQKLGTLYDTPDVFAFEAHKQVSLFIWSIIFDKKLTSKEQ